MNFKEELKLEMMQSFVNLYGINKKLDKVCLYMVHLLISQKMSHYHTFPFKMLSIVNQIIYKIDEGQSRLLEDLMVEEVRSFIEKTSFIRILDGLEKDLFERSNNFLLQWRVSLFELLLERSLGHYYISMCYFRLLYIEGSADKYAVSDVIALFRKCFNIHRGYADSFYFFVEELVCELVDYYRHDDKYSCRLTHQGWLVPEIIEYPEAIRALIDFMLELKASRMLRSQRKNARLLRNQLIKFGWKFPEKKH